MKPATHASPRRSTLPSSYAAHTPDSAARSSSLALYVYVASHRVDLLEQVRQRLKHGQSSLSSVLLTAVRVTLEQEKTRGDAELEPCGHLASSLLLTGSGLQQPSRFGRTRIHASSPTRRRSTRPRLQRAIGPAARDTLPGMRDRDRTSTAHRRLRVVPRGAPYRRTPPGSRSRPDART